MANVLNIENSGILDITNVAATTGLGHTETIKNITYGGVLDIGEPVEAS